MMESALRGVLTRTGPVLHGAARESLRRVPDEPGSYPRACGVSFLLSCSRLDRGSTAAERKATSAPSSRCCRGSPAIAPQAALRAVHPWALVTH